jgi:drug/metabolite transporter (DMT)-like permease
MSPITLSLIIYITPLVALLVDYLVYREVVALRTVLGMFIIFAGITLTEAERYRRR